MAANSIADITLEQLRRAVQLKEQIETLERELAGIQSERVVAPKAARGRYKRTAAMRARMAAAQRARWSKKKAKIIKGVWKAVRKLDARMRKRLARRQKS